MHSRVTMSADAQPPGPTRPDDALSRRLADFDEQLFHSTDDADELVIAPAEDPALESLEAIVRRLERRWPRARTSASRDQGADVAADPNDDGLHFGRFRIERELGRGGMGVVLQAYDPKLRRRVALKIPRIELLADDDKLQRFQDEAKAAGKLDHPHIVPIFEAGSLGPTTYIVSAFCGGPDLARWIGEAQQPAPIRDAVDLVRKLALAV
jgi:hypothetical protein